MKIRAAKKEQEPEAQNMVVLDFGNRTKKFEVWRYYEILGELLFEGVDRFDALDAARWAARAKPGERREIGEVAMEVKNAT